MSKEFNVAEVIPSKSNIARLLEELNEGICVGCGGRATRTNFTLCQSCWNDTECFAEDEKE